jgi:hypothetical protein
MSLTPDVIVIDVNLPDGSGLDAARQLRAELPSVGIVVLTMYDDDEHLFAALEAQASAFVAKSAPTDEVLSAAKHAASSRTPSRRPTCRGHAPPDGPGQAAAVGREQEVLDLLGQGLTIPVLAEAALHQRVDGEDVRLEALREARREQPQPGDRRSGPARAAQGARPRSLTPVNPPNGRDPQPPGPAGPAVGAYRRRPEPGRVLPDGGAGRHEGEPCRWRTCEGSGGRDLLAPSLALALGPGTGRGRAGGLALG